MFHWCIDDQIHDDLLELALVRLGATQRGIFPHAELDVISHQAAKHALHVLEDPIQVQHPRIQHLVSAECQQLSDE